MVSHCSILLISKIFSSANSRTFEGNRFKILTILVAGILSTMVVFFLFTNGYFFLRKYDGGDTTIHHSSDFEYVIKVCNDFGKIAIAFILLLFRFMVYLYFTIILRD